MVSIEPSQTRCQQRWKRAQRIVRIRRIDLIHIATKVRICVSGTIQSGETVLQAGLEEIPLASRKTLVCTRLRRLEADAAVPVSELD